MGLQWPPFAAALREMLDRLPQREEEPVCDECQLAFWPNIGFLDLFMSGAGPHGQAMQAWACG
jgi:hypothetical protein